jgi:hypothetical protein
VGVFLFLYSQQLERWQARTRIVLREPAANE